MKLVGKSRQMPARLMKDPAELRRLLDPTRWTILKAIAEQPDYPSALAKRLGMDEQKVYYHVNQLKKLGVISVARTEERKGALARFFSTKDSAYAIALRDEWGKPSARASQPPALLSGFYSDGSFDAKIILGSPDPHGPHQARARDSYYAADLCLYLGSFSSSAIPSVHLDTEVREKEIQGNSLILVGGPITNMVTARINDELPIRMKIKDRWGIHSTLTGKTYYENAGLVVKSQSPFNKDKSILVLAGSSIGGTKAAILSVIQNPDSLSSREAWVVEGLDMDGDGVVDAVEVKE